MKQEAINNQEVTVTVTTVGFGKIIEYKCNLGTFYVTRKDNDYYGNPVYIIAPQGYVYQLPKIEGCRRNNNKQWYTTQSYNIDDTMEHFLMKLEEQINKGNKLYHNQ